MTRSLRALLLLLMLQPGCVSLSQLGERRGPEVFGGTRAYARALGLIADPDPPACGNGQLLLCAIAPVDLPLSLVADALLLPVSVGNELRRVLLFER